MVQVFSEKSVSGKHIKRTKDTKEAYLGLGLYGMINSVGVSCPIGGRWPFYHLLFCR